MSRARPATRRFGSRVAAPGLRAATRRAPTGNASSRATTLPDRPLRYAFVATLGVGAALTVLAAVSTLATVLVYIGLALFLALALDPVLQFAARWRVPRWTTAVALGVILLSAVMGLVFALIPTVSAQVQVLADQAVAFVTGIPRQEWFLWVSDATGMSADLHDLTTSLTDFVSDPNQLLTVAGGIFAVGTGIVDGVTGVIIVSILTLYFALTLPRMKAKAYLLIAATRRARTVTLLEDIMQSVGRYVGGQLLLAIVNALFTFALMAVLGTPAPLILAVVAFVGALIPVVGTVFGSAIAVLATLTVSPGAALIAAIVLLVYMQCEAYVLSPRVMARAVAVPGALVIISALAGAALGGVLGALVAVPVAAAGLTVLNRVIIPARARV